MIHATVFPWEVLSIGSSTGGVDALKNVLKHFPEHFPVPIVITQHIIDNFGYFLINTLQSATKLKVKLAEQGEELKAGVCYVAPGGKHLTFSLTRTVVINDGPQVNSVKPSVDVMINSLINVYQKKVFHIMLTGIGEDGLEGVRKLKKIGGHSLAQDEKSSVVWGMPGAVVKAGLADETLALNEIGPYILARFHVFTNNKVS